MTRHQLWISYGWILAFVPLGIALLAGFLLGWVHP